VKKRFTISTLVFFYILFGFSQNITKKPLDHSVYGGWKDLRNQTISDNGKIVVCEIDSQQGDGVLFVYYVDNNKFDTVQRGVKPVFTP